MIELCSFLCGFELYLKLQISFFLTFKNACTDGSISKAVKAVFYVSKFKTGKNKNINHDFFLYFIEINSNWAISIYHKVLYYFFYRIIICNPKNDAESMVDQFKGIL